MIGLALAILSPFIITIIVSLGLKLWHKAVNDNAPLSFLSRLTGSAFNVLWGGSYVAVLLVLIGMVPIRTGKFKNVQDDVLASRSYSLLENVINRRMPNVSLDMRNLGEILQDPEKFEQFQSSEEFKTLSADQKLHALLSDKETAQQIQDKDYNKLLSNPKMLAVLKDKELLGKIFALNKKIIEEGLPTEPEEQPTESPPRVITIEKPVTSNQ